jgi:hypothetical protein
MSHLPSITTFNPVSKTTKRENWLTYVNRTIQDLPSDKDKIQVFGSGLTGEVKTWLEELSLVLKKKYSTVEELFLARWVNKTKTQQTLELEVKLELQEEELASVEVQIGAVLASRQVPSSMSPSIPLPDNHSLHNRILDADESFTAAPAALQDAKGTDNCTIAFTEILNALYVLGEKKGMERGRSERGESKQKMQEEPRMVAAVQPNKGIVLEGFEPDFPDEDPVMPLHSLSPPTFKVTAVQTEPLAEPVATGQVANPLHVTPDISFPSTQRHSRRCRRGSRKPKPKPSLPSEPQPAPSRPNSPVITRKHPNGIGPNKPVEVHVIQDAQYKSKPKGRRCQDKGQSWYGSPMFSELGRILVMLGRSRRFDLFS